MFSSTEAHLVTIQLLKNMKALTPAIAEHRKAGQMLSAALLQSEFDHSSAAIDKIRALTCSAHDWKTDVSGLIDTCQHCGEQRA